MIQVAVVSQRTCPSLKFSVAQWLEHLTGVWKTGVQFPSGTQKLFLSSFHHSSSYYVLNYAFVFQFMFFGYFIFLNKII